jgi:NCS2 family nucleobase:cation symporter-2
VYWVAGAVALLLSLSPKFEALINTIPAGVLGGATVVLYGLIGVLGARIWVQARVDFANPANLMTAAVALIIGIANFEWKIGDLMLNGIALGSIAAIVVYHVMRQIGIRRGTVAAVGTLPEPVQPAGAAAGSKRAQARRRRP